jgi:hypothetical protein
MIDNKLSKYWMSSDHHEFELLATYTLANDKWARYRDILNDREYTCRLEAFLARFYPTVD